MSRQSISYPAPGRYRLAPGLRLLDGPEGQSGGLVIASYPLRVLRLGQQAWQLLKLCRQERSSAELARLSGLPPQRVASLCERLTARGLLEAGPPPPPKQWPAVSVIVPTCNRAHQLERCLQALLELDYPAQALEVIVVDDGSRDRTAALLARLAPVFARRGVRLHCLRHTRRQGAASARNSGAAVARYELLAFVDDDCVVTPGWLTTLVPLLAETQVAAVGGQIRAYETGSSLGRYEDVRSSLFMGWQPQEVRLSGPLTYLPTACLLVRHEAWQAVGGFASLTCGEDVDFCYRLLAQGWRIRYWPAPEGTVYHDYRTRLVTFLGTRVRYASAEAVLQQLHPAQRRILLLPPLEAGFAALTVGGLWQMLTAGLAGHSLQTSGRQQQRRMGTLGWAPLSLLLALLFPSVSLWRRWRLLRLAHVSLTAWQIWRATLRSYLAYTYHLCRHLTRYYTLALLVAGLLWPPLLILAGLLQTIVVSVDYARLGPRLSLPAFALYSLLEDCAYALGLLLGCWRRRTWQPLLAVIQWKLAQPSNPGSSSLPSVDSHDNAERR
ncbi:mycofactocin biosynthesis glycosyltransferase MftF [Thermogemmatispora sp.]|uniref:mycofactocin biosynthesis glycosyltransferase MftF n=1 Tax=Thermogemmatispora sp. TaxID=1968838 RepID=UPI001DF60AD2|nr:mycofactocin biosynthesis glycosyltransferase MftF [Thermogemmatispora sp.]MBX5449031.1 mycofactocin biosynthesis glycosyltransferase MftF [Thermogemmatispora sp.]